MTTAMTTTITTVAPPTRIATTRTGTTMPVTGVPCCRSNRPPSRRHLAPRQPARQRRRRYPRPFRPRQQPSDRHRSTSRPSTATTVGEQPRRRGTAVQPGRYWEPPVYTPTVNTRPLGSLPVVSSPSLSTTTDTDLDNDGSNTSNEPTTAATPVRLSVDSIARPPPSYSPPPPPYTNPTRPAAVHTARVRESLIIEDGNEGDTSNTPRVPAFDRHRHPGATAAPPPGTADTANTTGTIATAGSTVPLTPAQRSALAAARGGRSGGRNSVCAPPANRNVHTGTGHTLLLGWWIGDLPTARRHIVRAGFTQAVNGHITFFRRLQAVDQHGNHFPLPATTATGITTFTSLRHEQVDHHPYFATAATTGPDGWLQVRAMVEALLLQPANQRPTELY